MKKLIFYSISFLSLQSLIVFLALFNPSKELSPFVSGYPVHFIAVFCSVILLYLTLTHEYLSIRYPLLLATLYGFSISIAGEYIQLFISYRSFDYLDMLSGAIATSLACIVLYGFFLLSKKHK